jgi:hypothetical protein
MNSFRLQSTHVLVDCADSKEGWMEAGLADVIQCRLQNFQSTQEVIFYICSKEETEVAERVAVMAWIIWNSINNGLWNNNSHSNTVGSLSKAYVE